MKIKLFGSGLRPNDAQYPTDHVEWRGSRELSLRAAAHPPPIPLFASSGSPLAHLGDHTESLIL
ncbi:hypothetical protein J6590_073061, partial [Homalodisca vitripennis]